MGFFRCFISCGVFLSSIICASEKETKRVAICYFGLPRSLVMVYPTHYKYIFDVLKEHQIDFDVFVHTWQVNGKQRIWDKELSVPIDYRPYKKLRPKHYKMDIQDEFLATLEFNKFFYKEVYETNIDYEWHPTLLLNHLCALESQKRVTQMVEASDVVYDYIIYVRPDVKFYKPLDSFLMLSLKDGDIMIPGFADHEGYNDRFAILTYNTAPIYGKRIDGASEFRKTVGRITAEKYVGYTCTNNNLNVIFIDFPFDIIRPF